ncbi:MAG: LysR family transcriptional regulator [Gammaproteobacteria bacterium]
MIELENIARHASLRQLQVFAAIVHQGSFTKAAEILHLTQPTVSMQMSKLSQTIGMPLLEQANRKVQMTAAGEVLYKATRDIFGTFSRLEMEIADLKGLKYGRLRLTALTTAQYFAPRILGEFSKRFPGIEVSLNVINREHLIERLSRNEDDIYILGQSFPPGIKIKASPFAENKLVVIASSEHPLAGRKNIPLKEITSESFIMREPGSGIRDAVFRLFNQYKLTPNTGFELGSNEAIKHAIVAGLGISVLSHTALTLENPNGPLTILDVENFPIQRQWYLVYPEGKKLSLVAQAFHDFCMQEGARLVATPWKL